MKQPDNFRQALIAAYRENPCQVLPNALWKSLPWAEEFKTEFKVEAGEVTRLLAWNQQQLMLYWSQNRRLQELPIEDAQSTEFALLHQDFEAALNLDDFPNRHQSFRLLRKMEALPLPALPIGFSFMAANPINEAQAISDLIGTCYENIHPRPETVQGWSNHPVFAADLWVWIMDEARNTPAALGIADFDPTIAEGSLEWIQVLPRYRGQGFGKQLVYVLLNRLKGRAKFTTVAGQVDNATCPEMLYRRCGFEGDDVWWVLRR